MAVLFSLGHWPHLESGLCIGQLVGRSRPKGSSTRIGPLVIKCFKFEPEKRFAHKQSDGEAGNSRSSGVDIHGDG